MGDEKILRRGGSKRGKRIKKCNECDYVDRYYCCFYVGIVKPMSSNPATTIPSWCPLPDAKIKPKTPKTERN